ncbi:TetR family transcriptional regulator [Glycomyces mayteni]|uniref:TetR family transcriptional regulator n=1 Tax=Glycomyces mayteni TaxID=543887 RepID=A0ABW2D904_9ACTN|nr:TetR/AcrR family transcriptional regulator [Glycomyces mayteni]
MNHEFRRARTEEQRAERRAAILTAARGLLYDVRVADLTLTELARRSGLAKSNVLRYFESREAVLLEVYNLDFVDWLDELERELPATDPDVESVAAVLAESAVRRARMCELAANSPSVLERNLSGDVAAAYKLAFVANAHRFGRIVGERLGGYSDTASMALAAMVILGVGGIWAGTQPSPGMAAAYAAHPELAVMSHDTERSLREYIATVLTGLAHREPQSVLRHEGTEA